MPNCEVSHTWRREGGAAALGRSWLPPLMMMMMVTQWRRVKMDGRFISNRLIQTGSIGGKPDRTGGGQPQKTSAIEKWSVVGQGEFVSSVCCLVGG